MNDSRGSIIIAFMVVLVLSALGASVLLRTVNEASTAKRGADRANAMWVAEAGLNKALYEYNKNNCLNMVNASTGAACTGCSTCGVGNKKLAQTLASYGDYDVTLDSSNTTLQATGSVPSRSSASKLQRSLQSSIGRPQIYSHGIFAQGQVTLSNNALVDSYNSSSGAYGGSNINSNGSVGTNGTGANIIDINNNAVVKGNLSTGIGGTVSMDNGTVVTGTVTHNNSIALPAVVVPSTLTGLSAGGTYTLNNNASGTISTGDYKYTKLDLKNNTTLTISGNVRLYLTGTSVLTTGNGVNITIANGGSLTIYTDGVLTTGNNITFNTVSQSPSMFNIYSTYTGANGVNIQNNGNTYAGIYAPQTDVKISNNNAFYGAVVGKTTTLENNGAVHYDESLASMSNPFEDAIISNWQEI